MNKLPNLDFLYFDLEQNKENYINKWELFPYDFYDKVYAFDEYVYHCSLEQLISLFITIYIDKYPRAYFTAAISVDRSEQKKLLDYTNEMGREVSETRVTYTDFSRDDVTAMICEYHDENYTDDESIEKFYSRGYYVKNSYLEFTQEFPLEVIDKALYGRKYEKVFKEDTYFYYLHDSAIASLEIRKNSIKMNINEEKANFYFPVPY